MPRKNYPGKYNAVPLPYHDVSFVEATPRYDRKNKRAVSIELTDFSVYYTQGAAEAAIAAMKEGKSEVMCEQGQFYKWQSFRTRQTATWN